MSLSKLLRVGFVGVFSCLALLLGMFSFTGTAFAHSSAFTTQNPEISVSPSHVEPKNGCVVVTISGEDFSPSENKDDIKNAQFSAFDEDGRTFDVDPTKVQINNKGQFSVSAKICGKFQEHTLHIRAEDDATGRNSNTVSVTLDF